ncbi:MAG TPA: DUF2249 domain-containing protein [Ottowia sp.]|nr:DUF2249 domain-containing protein [Ottowia sp.]
MALIQPMQNLPGHDHRTPEAVYGFDARGVARRFRHAAIFGALDTLQPGEVMRFVNDHDPIPLLGQLTARYGEEIQIEYRQRSPEGVVIDFIRPAE